ncbi:hypothetical protein BD626DRAFT_413207 [Schizophyllum amplum]|uniref:Uncharacterized protein n=1 Tax=Schizophyllum amplum TaxID=97359 RepID=A0A550BW47_9AGAR|nr:hypothetical protein BD626DRAFT_414876 [Auriculariopsis ampla]TRM56757.1 hypothetical protein BD626DRAFT_413207 [Auriculariopsis ampla]
MAIFPKCYDVDAARERLAWVTASRVDAAPSNTLGVLFTSSAPPSRVKVVATERGRSRAAVEKGDGESELILEITGVVLKTDLPPIEKRLPPGRERYIRQAIKLTGLGLPMFESALSDIHGIREVFKRSVTGAVADVDNFALDDGYSIDISNRYFSSGHDVNEEDITEFDNDVDPRGYLAERSSPEFVHTKLNQVSYVAYSEDPTEDRPRYLHCTPAAVKIGDIVTCKLAFALVPMPRGKATQWKFLHVLRAIAVMDTSLTEAASATAVLEGLNISAKASSPATSTLKHGNITFDGALGQPPKRSKRYHDDSDEEVDTVETEVKDD